MSSAHSPLETAKAYPSRLKAVLQDLHENRCPHVENPPECTKRASVALIIRIRPTFPHQAFYDTQQCASTRNSFTECLDNFFSQSWVQEGDAEVLFIKRAARIGDRWTSHVAFPGGKRETADLDDRATSVRETREETGLELDTDHCLFIGNLPERILTTTWGKVPLMVLCPFVYLLMRHDLPPLALQPTEVHSTHWVPVTGLLAPFMRRFQHCDVSERFTRSSSPIARTLIRVIAGHLMFGALELRPTESLFSKSLSPSDLEDSNSGYWSVATSYVLSISWLKQDIRRDINDRELVLWGLTLGIAADFLELLDPEGASRLWAWPTFSPWDIRIVIWLMTYRFRSQKLREAQKTSHESEQQDVQIDGLDTTTFTTKITQRTKGLDLGLAGGRLLDGYNDRLRRAVLAALVMRLGIGAVLIAVFLRKYRRRVK